MSIVFSTQVSLPMDALSFLVSLQLGKQLNKLAWPNFPENLQEIEQLLKAGANPNIQVDKEGDTLLHKFARKDRYNALLALLLKYEANPRKENAFKLTPLHYAAINGAVTNTKLLLQANVPINIKDRVGDTPLHSLCRYLLNVKPLKHHAHLEVARILVNAGADLSQINKNGYTPIGFFSSKRLGQYPPIYEFQYLLRKKIAENFLNDLKQAHQQQDNYFALLPRDLLEPIALASTDEEYRAKPQVYYGSFTGDV